MKLFTLIIFVVLIPSIYGQDLESLNGKFDEYNTVEQKSYSWIKENVLMDMKFNILGEIFSPRAMNVELFKTSDYFENDTSRFVDKNLLVNLIGIGLEPRVNLIKKENFSLGIKGSIHLNLSLYANFDSWNKSTGWVHMNSTGMVYFAKGLSSTFNNTSEKGFAVSGGIMYLKAPLSGNDPVYNEGEYELTPSSDPFLRDTWLLPLVQFDYYLLTSDFKIRNLSLSLGYINQNTYFRFNYGFTF